MKLCLIMPHKTNVKLNFIQNMDNIMDICFILAEQYNFQLIGMIKNRNNPLGAKNNDSRPCMGASAILKSVYFRAFAVNVKTIVPTQKLYQLDTQYGGTRCR